MRAAFLVIMAIVAALTGYVAWSIWRMTPGGTPLKATLTGVFILWMLTFFVGFFVMEKLPVGVSAVVYRVGNTWLIAFLYLLIFFIVADAASLCHILPKGFMRNNDTALACIVAAVAMILAAGAIHYRHKAREEMSIRTEKPLDEPLTVVLASDLHLGYHNRRAELSRWVDLINREKPDLVLFGGDLIDMSLRPVLRDDDAEVLRRLAAPVYAVTGNHEYYAGIEAVEKFYKDAGIVLLKDSTAVFKGIRIVGRNDRTYPCRAALCDLMPSPDRFTIVLDHQPSHLEEAEEAGADFQFSGHTHRGQVWPISWITDAIFEKSWGAYSRGSTRYYVSSGLGIWGAGIRIGTRSEYLVLRISN